MGRGAGCRFKNSSAGARLRAACKPEKDQIKGGRPLPAAHLVRHLLKPVQPVDLVDGVHLGRQACASMRGWVGGWVGGVLLRGGRCWAPAAAVADQRSARTAATSQPLTARLPEQPPPTPPARTRMRAEQLVLDHRRQRQVVKQICQHLPYPRAAVLAQALLVKAVHLRDLAALVVPPDDHHALRPPHLRVWLGVVEEALRPSTCCADGNNTSSAAQRRRLAPPIPHPPLSSRATPTLSATTMHTVSTL